MADTITLNSGTGGAVINTDDIAGTHTQIVKIGFGALDALTLVTTGAGLPVQQQGTWDVGTVTTVTTVSTVTAVTDITNPVVVNGGVGQTADIKVTLDSETVAIASIAAGDNNIGNVDIVTVPADPFGADADAASATGSISAKLRYLAATGIAGMTALPAGTNAIGKLAANSGVDIGDVDVLSIAAGANLIGDVGLQGRATGGTSTFRSIDLDETEEEVKATAGTIYSIVAFNTTAAPLYLKLYNLTAANTTVGTSTPTHTYMVPGNGDSDGAGFVLNVPQGIAFSTAISAAVTTAVADSDVGAPGANACIVDIQYV